MLAPYIAPALLAAVAVKSAIAVALLTTALVVGAGLLATAITKGMMSAPTAAVGPPQVFRQSISNSFIVYGKRRVGGLLVFFHGKKVGKRHFRYFVIACAGHRCQGVTKWFLNDEEVTVNSGTGAVTSGAYAGAAWLWFVRGTSTDVANATFVSECGGKWTTDHKGLGIAKIYAKFEMTDDVVQAGMPNMTAEIEGRDEIFDYRDDTEKYTQNAALIFYDFMELPREEGGFGAYPDEIPDAAYISAQANVCDEVVNSEARYALNGVIVTGAAPSEVRDVLVVNCAGSYAYVGGKHLMRPGYWVPVSETLSEDDLAGPIQVSPILTSDRRANEVQGTWVDPDAGYQGTPFATQTTDPAPTDIRQLDLDLAFTTSPHQAARIARIMLNRAQAEKTVIWPMNLAGLKVQTLDTVALASDRYGLSNYAFSVINWSLSAEWGVVLALREENEDIYDAPSVVAPPSVPTIEQGLPVLLDRDLQLVIRDAYPVGVALTGQDNAGDGEVVISDFAVDWPGIGEVAVTGTTLTGLALDSTQYPYAEFDEIGDATPTFGTTAVYSDALNSAANPLRMYLFQQVAIPALGDPPNSGGGYGGGYGGGGAIPE